MQESVLCVLANLISVWELTQTSLQRVGSFLSGRGAAGTKQRLIYPCKDGDILYIVFGGRIGAPSNSAIVKWMDEEGMADDFIRDWKWEEYDFAVATPEIQERLEGYFAKFFLTHTKSEIYSEGLKRGFMVAPVSTPKDIRENAQLQSRNFWIDLEHPELNATLTYPSTFFKSSEMPFEARCRAPLIGEHNQEVYEALDISKEEIIALKQANVI
jgi:crotonobetainyl-CoA:carnitine CoA-transferase CaiB-like acyl-CoA transferase